jgi:hypothetical protein
VKTAEKVLSGENSGRFNATFESVAPATRGSGTVSDLLSPNVTTAVSIVGVMIRYSFYLVGAFVFALVGLALLWSWRPQVKPEPNQQPAFHLAASDLARLPMTSRVITIGGTGRIEAKRYGRLHDRDMDMTVAMIIPPKGRLVTGDLLQELYGLQKLGIMERAALMSVQSFHDLETRFGEMRAADLRIDIDGRRKLCLGFTSRFDIAAVFLVGWHCEANGSRPSAAELACMLDRMVLDAPLVSDEADAFMRQRASRAPSCSAVPVSQTTDTRTHIPRVRVR